MRWSKFKKDCCDRSEIAEETKPKDGVRKRVEKGTDLEGKEKCENGQKS